MLMRRLRADRFACFLTVAFVLAGPGAHAQSAPAPPPAAPTAPSDANAARAAELKKLGNEAMDRLDPARALGYYSEAYGLTQDPALLYNKARALQTLENYPDALDAFEQFVQLASPELKAKVPGLEQLVDDVRKKVGTLEVACNVEGAEVRIKEPKGERVLGKIGGGQRFRLNAGKKELLFAREGYFTETRHIDLPGGGLARVEVFMQSRAQGAKLRVSSSTAGALVSVDGRGVGVVPAEVSVNAGSHKITLQREGYEVAETTAIVDTGEDKRIDVPMVARSGILSKWWFWTGIGVVVAGGVVTTYALLKSRDPDSGTIPPGTVKTDPLLRF
jgi:hypothetical protein